MTLYPYSELTITSKVQECCGQEFAAKLGEFDYSKSKLSTNQWQHYLQNSCDKHHFAICFNVRETKSKRVDSKQEMKQMKHIPRVKKSFLHFKALILLNKIALLSLKDCSSRNIHKNG